MRLTTTAWNECQKNVMMMFAELFKHEKGRNAVPQVEETGHETQPKPSPVTQASQHSQPPQQLCLQTFCQADGWGLALLQVRCQISDSAPHPAVLRQLHRESGLTGVELRL